MLLVECIFSTMEITTKNLNNNSKNMLFLFDWNDCPNLIQIFLISIRNFKEYVS